MPSLSSPPILAFLVFLAVTSLLAGCSSLPPCPVPGNVAGIPADEIDAVLFLIGDAGEADPEGEPVLEKLEDAVRSAVDAHGAERVRVVFLGDNIYPSGLPDTGDSGFERARQRLEAELAVVASMASPAAPVALFVPGNHDWDNEGRDGLTFVRNQEAYLAENSGGRAALVPGGGCPGPVAVDVGERLRVIALDTQWWLQRRGRPEGTGSGCAAGSEDAVVELLRRQLAEADGRRAVVVAHHPFVSGGPHGANSGLRSIGLLRQDASNGTYRRMIDVLRGAFTEHPPLLYAAGHDHSLQLLRGSGTGEGGLPFYAVSGSGSVDNLTGVGALDATLFCREGSGFLRLDLARDGRVRLSAHLAESRTSPAAEIFSTLLAGGGS